MILSVVITILLYVINNVQITSCYPQIMVTSQQAFDENFFHHPHHHIHRDFSRPIYERSVFPRNFRSSSYPPYDVDFSDPIPVSPNDWLTYTSTLTTHQQPQYSVSDEHPKSMIDDITKLEESSQTNFGVPSRLTLPSNELPSNIKIDSLESSTQMNIVDQTASEQNYPSKTESAYSNYRDQEIVVHNGEETYVATIPDDEPLPIETDTSTKLPDVEATVPGIKDGINDDTATRFEYVMKTTDTKDGASEKVVTGIKADVNENVTTGIKNSVNVDEKSETLTTEIPSKRNE